MTRIELRISFKSNSFRSHRRHGFTGTASLVSNSCAHHPRGLDLGRRSLGACIKPGPRAVVAHRALPARWRIVRGRKLSCAFTFAARAIPPLHGTAQAALSLAL